MTDDTRSKQALIDELNALRKENRELKQAVDNASQSTTADQTSQPKNDPTILIVDDNKQTCLTVVDMLKKLGHDSISTDSAEKAIECIRDGNRQIYLVISDIVMPGKDGPDMMAAIHEINPEIKTIFMSGYTEDEIVHDSFYKIQDTAAAFLKKPFTLDELRSLLENQLGA